MKVLMMTNGYKGCGYVRLSLPAWQEGFELATTASEMKEKMNYADVVVFHRPEKVEYLAIAEELRRRGKKVVIDNDDTFRMNSHPLAQFTPEAEEIELKKREESITAFLKVADLATVTTEVLSKEYKENNENVVILPNCVDPLDWEEPLHNETDKVRIGLVGSVAMEYDYRHIQDVLKKLSDRKDVQLFMFGLGDKKHREENPKVTEAFQDDYDFWDSLDIEHQPWCDISEYPTKINEARLDIMLIPRKDNYFNQCKSNVKFLEAAMCEVPVIAQSFEKGPYEELTDDIGLKIKDNGEWEDKIESLISDKKKRREMGEKAREYVLKNYNIEDRSHEWEDAYAKLFV